MDLEQKAVLITSAGGLFGSVVMQCPNQRVANVAGFDREAPSQRRCYANAHFPGVNA